MRAPQPTSRSRLHLQQRDRMVVWAPVWFGSGVGLYFALPMEPPVWLAPMGLCGCFLLLLISRDRPMAVTVAVTLCALICAGLWAAGLRTLAVDAPQVSRKTTAVTVSGSLERVQALERGLRIVMTVSDLEPWTRPEPPPERIRIRIGARAFGSPPPQPGDGLSVRAVLLPPPAPVMPGGYDFGQLLFFQGIGAVGYAVSDVTMVIPEEAAIAAGGGMLASGWRAEVETLRQTITNRLLAGRDGGDGRDGVAGALAAALITGERRAVPEEVQEAFRGSGLAHMLAISGLHMSMVAGFTFLLLRRVLAGVPVLALTQPIKAWAAGAALLVAFGYLLISGSGIPAQRAFLMTALALLAVLVNRSPFSMRLVACAALVMLALRPEALLSPGFRMSFAAVVALVAVYEAYGPALLAVKQRQDRGWRPDIDQGWSRWRSVLWSRLGHPGLMYFGLITLTTTVASLATAPFAAAEFHRVAVWSILGNLPAVPLMAFVIMPGCFLALLLMPLGLEGWVLTGLAPAFDGLVIWAQWVSGLPYAELRVPDAPDWVLLLPVFGGLWLCLEPGPRRFWGVLTILIGVVLPWHMPRPAILVDREGSVIALRGPTGALWESPGRGGRFVRQIWDRAHGPSAGPWPEIGAGAGPHQEYTPLPMRCDGSDCVLFGIDSTQATIAVPRTTEALSADCLRADLIITALWDVAEHCARHRREMFGGRDAVEDAAGQAPIDGTKPPIIIDGGALYRSGAHALYARPDGHWRIETVGDRRGRRPWTGRRGP